MKSSSCGCPTIWTRRGNRHYEKGRKALRSVGRRLIPVTSHESPGCGAVPRLPRVWRASVCRGQRQRGTEIRAPSLHRHGTGARFAVEYRPCPVPRQDKSYHATERILYREGQVPHGRVDAARAPSVRLVQLQNSAVPPVDARPPHTISVYRSFLRSHHRCPSTTTFDNHKSAIDTSQSHDRFLPFSIAASIFAGRTGPVIPLLPRKTHRSSGCRRERCAAGWTVERRVRR